VCTCQVVLDQFQHRNALLCVLRTRPGALHARGGHACVHDLGAFLHEGPSQGHKATTVCC
jgi:hypothetical protein